MKTRKSRDLANLIWLGVFRRMVWEELLKLVFEVHLSCFF